jgi:acetylornithine deacetylase/succinyl-diaminopimelate desuccinylase-like protein
MTASFAELRMASRHSLLTSTRVALRGVVAVVLVVASAGAVNAANAEVPVPLAREILTELIGINTTQSHGTTPAAFALAKRFRAAGFAPGDVVEIAPAAHPEQGNLVVRLHGKGKGKPVLYIGHLDVVDARREDWDYDPFTLTEKDGWLYGRGTIDMKGQDAALAANLIALRRAGFVPDRDVIAAFTADEEGGDLANGVAFLLREHRPLIDAGLAINPDGGEAGMKKGRRLYVAMQTSEKVFYTLTLTLTDKGGHSSRPTASNPIYRLAADLTKLADFRFPVHLTDTTRAYFAARAKLEAGQVRADMLAVSGAKPDAAAVERLSQQVETNILLRSTCTVTEIAGGHAENALPQRVEATLQCRILPGESLDGVREQIAARTGDPDLQIGVRTSGKPSPESPLTPRIVDAVERVTRSIWPGVIVLPQMSPGATDSLYLRGAGIPAYGVDGMFDDLDDGRAHGRDERIGVAQFADEVRFAGELLREVSRAP